MTGLAVKSSECAMRFFFPFRTHGQWQFIDQKQLQEKKNGGKTDAISSELNSNDPHSFGNFDVTSYSRNVQSNSQPQPRSVSTNQKEEITGSEKMDANWVRKQWRQLDQLKQGGRQIKRTEKGSADSDWTGEHCQQNGGQRLVDEENRGPFGAKAKSRGLETVEGQSEAAPKSRDAKRDFTEERDSPGNFQKEARVTMETDSVEEERNEDRELRNTSRLSIFQRFELENERRDKEFFKKEGEDVFDNFKWKKIKRFDESSEEITSGDESEENEFGNLAGKELEAAFRDLGLDEGKV